MKHFCLITILSIAAHSAWAIVDLDGDGMSDVWEQAYNAQALDPNTDSDGDGQNNVAEGLAGTNPFDSNAVLRLTHLSIGNGLVTLRWNSAINQRCQVQSSPDVTGTNWQDLGTPFVGTGQEMTASFGLNPSAKFFRVLVSSLDSDDDGVTDWEEAMVGFNPHAAYTSGGTTDDLTAITSALQSTVNTVKVVATDPYATRIGGDTGTFTITRSGKLDAVNVNFTVAFWR
jgi:hypothetical protein